MNELNLNVSRADQNAASVNKVVRNTYTLLSMTLFFSALCAVATMALGFGQGAGLLMIIGGFVMSFVVRATAESSKGILAVFVFAGLMGGGLGPTLSAYLMIYSNGAAIIAQALGGTGLIFLSLSGYALTTGKNFNFLGGFLATGMMVMLVAMIAPSYREIAVTIVPIWHHQMYMVRTPQKRLVKVLMGRAGQASSMASSQLRTTTPS